MLKPFTDFLDANGVHAGLAAGAVWVGLSAAGRRASAVASAIAVTGVVAAAVSVDATRRPAGVIVGVGLLALVAVRKPAPWVGVVLAAPGAFLLGALVDHRAGWVPLATGVVALVGAAGAADLARRHRADAVTGTLLAGAALAVYIGVPDTERGAVVLAWLAPLLLVSWPTRFAPLVPAGAAAAAGLVAWAGAADGFARPGAIVGVLACVAALAIEPACHLVAKGPFSRRTPHSSDGPILIAALGATMLFCSRVAGLHNSTVPALVLSGAALSAVFVGGLALAGLRR